MAKWEIIEDKKLKKQVGGAAKAATRNITANKTASNTQPVTSNQSVITPIVTKTDKPVYVSKADYTNKRYGAPSITPQFGQSVQVANFEGDAQPFYDDVATNEYKAYVKDYQQKVVDDKVSEFLKANPLPKTDKSKADYIENLSPYDRQLIQSSSSSNQFLPAFRQYEKRIGENAKKYSFTEAYSDPDKLSEVTHAGLNRFRVFPDATNSIEDFVNPGLWFGQMEQGLGNIPKNIRDKNYLAATMAVVNPLLMGRAIGSGSINPLGKSFWTNEVSNAQFINNLVNPLAGIVDANTVKGLGNKAVDKYIGNSFTPELGNIGAEAFGLGKPTVLENTSFVNTVEPQTSFFSRNPSVFTNRTIPQETTDLSRREIFNRISQRQPTTRRTYTLGNEEDLVRFNANNNLLPPPSEYQTAMNLLGVNFSEAELNAMNVRDIARGLQDNINTSSNMSRIDLDALTPYKNLTLDQLVIKNPSLAEKLKNAFKGIKSNIKNVADKTAEKLTVANQKLGEIIEPLPIINENKFQKDLTEKLNTGVGIKKGNTQISLKQRYPEYNPYEYQVFIKTPDATDLIHSGNMQLRPEINQRSFTDILLNKNKYQGLQKPYDFPLEKLKGNPNFNLDLPEYKGISAEIGEATKQALKNQNKKFDLLSSKSHTDEGGTRYLTEFLNGRKPVIDISGNKEWLEMATELKNSLKGKPIKKEEVKKILAGDKYGASPNEEYKAILKNKLFPKGVQFKYKEGGIIEDPMGQWAHPGSVTRIPSNQITMKNVNYPVLGVSDKGHTQMMYPGEDYSFRGNSVTEYPMMQSGGRYIPESVQPQPSKNYTGTFLPINRDPYGNARKKLFDNENGSPSTESVIGINDDSGYYNIPTVVNGVRLSDDDAVNNFYDNGMYHTGYFNTQEEADRSADYRERANIGLSSTGLYKYGGEVNFTYAGENHRVYEKVSPTGNGKGIEGHIMVNHPTENKGKWDTIDLTKITNGKVKTVPQGVASTKKWHKENPEYANGGKISNWEILEDTNEDYEYKNGGKTPAWQRKEGKSPSGGLNAKGRASLKKEGHDIKPPQPEGGSRKKSFCARMTGLKKKLTGSKKANDPNSRVNLSLKKWKC
jgi:hypothetical protein